uniref:Crip-31 n=1 Tax=Volkameria inermis TaxID=49994 RepID=Q8H6H8_VOLIN|nr:Crip-31 [Volkameria inermis]
MKAIYLVATMIGLFVLPAMFETAYQTPAIGGASKVGAKDASLRCYGLFTISYITFENGLRHAKDSLMCYGIPMLPYTNTPKYVLYYLDAALAITTTITLRNNRNLYVGYSDPFCRYCRYHIFPDGTRADTLCPNERRVKNINFDSRNYMYEFNRKNLRSISLQRRPRPASPACRSSSASSSSCTPSSPRSPACSPRRRPSSSSWPSRWPRPPASTSRTYRPTSTASRTTRCSTSRPGARSPPRSPRTACSRSRRSSASSATPPWLSKYLLKQQASAPGCAWTRSSRSSPS